MNFITLDYLFWVKEGQIFVNLFKGSNKVIVFSESSILQSDVFFFVQASTKLLQWSVAALFQYTFVENFTANFKFIRGDVLAAVCLTT